MLHALWMGEVANKNEKDKGSLYFREYSHAFIRTSHLWRTIFSWETKVLNQNLPHFVSSLCILYDRFLVEDSQVESSNI